MKKQLFSFMLVLFGIGTANAQKIYTSIHQDGAKIANLGTAAFDLSASSHPTVEFDENGKAVMKIGESTVAALPMSNNGQLVVEFETAVAEEDLNKVNKTVSSAGYATLYSPFQLVPGESEVEVYAPFLLGYEVQCNSKKRIVSDMIIPVETGLLLRNEGDIVFTISADATTSRYSALSGSSLAIDKDDVELGEGECLYTLGHDKNDSSRVGFFKYTGSSKLKAGYAWLVAPEITSGECDYITISFDNNQGTTGIKNLTPTLSKGEGVRKYMENGKVVIIKNGKKYNLNGQEVR